MADKFIRHGETYNGDGTSSAAAASNGGVGAWNTINILTGTAPAYGALAAGDVVHIRSKDAAGNNIVRAVTGNTNVGSSSATSGAPISWVLDGGVIWPGVSGTLSISCSVTSAHNITGVANNNFFADVKDSWVWEYTHANPYGYLTFLDNITTKNLKISFPNRAASTAYPGGAIFSTGVHRHMTISGKSFSGNSNSVPVKTLPTVAASVSVVFIDLTLEIFEAATAGLISFPTGYGVYPGKVRVVGGRITGAGASTTSRLFAGDCAGEALCENFLIPATMRRLAAGTPRRCYFGAATNVDGVNGTHMSFSWGEADSRQDGYYPHLNATLPDTMATGWAWRVYPYGAVSYAPVDIHTNKFYTGETAACTITQNVLVSDNFTATESDIWMEVCYIDDATGELVTESTQDSSGAVSSSTAPWIAAESGGKPTYGATAFDKKKIVLTTSREVRQNTMIGVFFHSVLLATADTHLLFVDPDPSVVSI